MKLINIQIKLKPDLLLNPIETKLACELWQLQNLLIDVAFYISSGVIVLCI